jgi:hypothetical protein
MPVPEDFANSSDRYWIDADTLFNNGRLATADHLFGVSAECALKAIMVRLSGQATLDKRFKIHLPNIWEEFIAYIPISGTHPYSSNLTSNPFSGWDVGDRYGNENQFTPARVNSVREASKQARKVLEQARLDGVLQ